MRDPNRALQLALDLARRERDAAAVRLAQATQQQQQALAQQQQLDAYAAESARQWFQRGQQGVAMALLSQHTQFMVRLDRAIAFQGHAIDGCQQRTHLSRQQLLHADQKLQRYQHLLNRRQAEAAERAARQEQKATDELAMLMHRRQAPRSGAVQPRSPD